MTTTKNAIVWAEIPVTDMSRAIAFYESVLGQTLTMEEGGPNPMALFAYDEAAGVGGHLYPGTPAAGGAGPTVHLAVPDAIEDAAARCEAAGGKIVGPVITIPPGRFQYAIDLDGNSIGLFELGA